MALVRFLNHAEHTSKDLLILATHLHWILAINLVDNVPLVLLIPWHVQILQHGSHLTDRDGIRVIVKADDLGHDCPDVLAGNLRNLLALELREVFVERCDECEHKCSHPTALGANYPYAVAHTLLRAGLSLQTSASLQRSRIPLVSELSPHRYKVPAGA